MNHWIQRGSAVARQLDRLQPVLLLAARLYVAMVFFRAGWLKAIDWSSTLALFHDTYKVPVLPPELAAYAGTFGELFFSLLVAFGLAGRIGAAGLFAVNVMAVASYLDLYTFECPAGINAHYTWGAILMALVVFGPGKLSIDELLMRRLGRSSAGAARTAATVG